MIHLIWSGKGFLVAIVTFAFALAANLIANSVTGSQAYWDAHKWPLAIALFLSAGVCWFLGNSFQSQPTRVLVDPKTGDRFVFRRNHTFFFIPVIWWGPILAVCGLFALGAEFLK